ncbi:MAG: hypothetical protein AB8F78_09145 [Saprospiraceae bacterium]
MKLVFLNIVVFLLLTSCQTSTPESARTTPTLKGAINETAKLKEQPNSPCIDTSLLNQMNVQHRTILEVDKETWVLKFTKPVEASNITTLSYFYSCNIKPKDCNDTNKWFQVDSIQVQQSGGEIQTLNIQANTAGTNLEGLNTPNSKLIDVNFD